MSNPELNAGIKKERADKTIFIIVGLFVFFLFLYILGTKNTWESWVNGLFGNIAASLGAGAVTYLLVLPKMKYKEQELFHEIYEGKKLRDVKIAEGKAFELKDPISETMHIITDDIRDVSEIIEKFHCFKGDSSAVIERRICLLFKQPTMVQDSKHYKEKLEEIKSKAEGLSDIKIKYYNNANLPYYARVDNDIYVAQNMTNQKRYIQCYQAKSEITRELDKWFLKLWKGENLNVYVSDNMEGRYTNSQENAIETALKYFCERFRKEIKIDKKVEAVVVLWTKEKKKRMTFYSCNKDTGMDLHRVVKCDIGIVGTLQKEVLKEETPDCVILYDASKEYRITYQIWRFNRADEIEVNWIFPQKWKKKDTKSMLAIPIFDENNKNMIGALTYDVPKAIRTNNEVETKKAMRIIQECRDVINPMLGTNIIVSHEELLRQLEKKEKTDFSDKEKEEMKKAIEDAIKEYREAINELPSEEERIKASILLND